MFVAHTRENRMPETDANSISRDGHLYTIYNA